MSQCRFIPAYAGNTSSLRVVISISAVHPRICREHFILLFLGQLAIGSSPRMRGTLGLGGKLHKALRFIPTYAGNTHYDAGEIIESIEAGLESFHEVAEVLNGNGSAR